MHTPHFDELAQTSLVLTKNYVQQAVCSPTRTSLLTGRRPDRTRVFDLYSYFRTVAANYTTIPEFFRLHGYETIGMGCARARTHTCAQPAVLMRMGSPRQPCASSFYAGRFSRSSSKLPFTGADRLFVPQENLPPGPR